MRILVVNDDGIASRGLLLLAEAASHFGEVTIIAPAAQCSAMSQRLCIFQDLPLVEHEFPPYVKKAYSLGGSPADCVKTAMEYLLPQKPDLVFSGINSGFNTGFDIAYSGTVGAAMEGIMNGVPSFAFSARDKEDFDFAVPYLVPTIRELLDREPLTDGIWNVNFPAEQCLGKLYDRYPAPMEIYRNHFVDKTAADGTRTLKYSGELIGAMDAPNGSDIRAVLSGYISIGKIRCSVL